MFEEHEVLDKVVGVTHVRLRTWVARGWICPAQSETGTRYTDVDVARCRMLCTFEDDLGIDADHLPVVLSLLDQVYGLRRQLKSMTQAIEEQPDRVRSEIHRRIRQAASDE